MFFHVTWETLPTYVFIFSLVAIGVVLLAVVGRWFLRRRRVVSDHHDLQSSSVVEQSRVINLADGASHSAAQLPRVRPVLRDIQLPARPGKSERVVTENQSIQPRAKIGRTMLKAALLCVVIAMSALVVHSSVRSDYQAVESMTIPQSWYSSDWSHRIQLTVNHEQVAEDLVDFPVLVALEGPDHDVFSVSATGQDIVFTAADGTTKLSHEIETYDPENHVLLAWVKVPQVSAREDVTLYLYYGNAAAPDQSEAKQVWTNGYVAVYNVKDHQLEPGLTDSIRDSADKLYQVPRGETQVVLGKIGGALEFNGQRDVVDIGELAFGDNSSPVPMTVSAWVNPYVRTGTILGKRDATRTQWQLFLDQRGYLNLKEDTSGWWPGHQSYGTAKTGLLLNRWQYVAITLDESGTPIFYTDGLGETGSYRNGTFKTYSFPVSIGARWSYYPVTDYNFIGLLDTIRVANVVRSSGWIATEHANQAYPTTFVQVAASSQTRDSVTQTAGFQPLFLGRFSVLESFRRP